MKIKFRLQNHFEINAKDSSDLNNVTKTASDSTMYVNSWKNGNTDNTSYGLVKFDLENYEFFKASAFLLITLSQGCRPSRPAQPWRYFRAYLGQTQGWAGR